MKIKIIIQNENENENHMRMIIEQIHNVPILCFLNKSGA